MKHIARSAIVQCDAGTFYALVADIESYPGFLPWCAAAEVLERAQDRTVARLTLSAGGLRKSFTTANRNLPGEAIEMTLQEGPFRHFHALWRFTPLGDKACKAEFSMDYEFSSRLVAGLLEPVFSRMADSTVEAFRKRAEAGARA
jgi:ribosome-associated toxin RatA of RatAB toxin-antitoxin module